MSNVNRIFNSLIKPYFFLCLINLVIYSAENIVKHSFSVQEFIKSLGAICIGLDGCEGIIIGCGTLWFVYSLAIIKFLAIYLNKSTSIIVAILFSVLGVLLHYFDMNYYWAITNVLLAYPLFVLGQCCRYAKVQLVIDKLKQGKCVVFLVVSMVLLFAVYVISSFNGSAWMFKGEYGNNMLLFFIGAILGTIALSLISISLNRYGLNLIRMLSVGNILILAFQWKVCCYVVNYTDKYIGFGAIKDICLCGAAVLIMLAFIPVIKLFCTYLPAVVGGRRY